jgi:hypothetical protein
MMMPAMNADDDHRPDRFDWGLSCPMAWLAANACDPIADDSIASAAFIGGPPPPAAFARAAQTVGGSCGWSLSDRALHLTTN